MPVVNFITHTHKKSLNNVKTGRRKKQTGAVDGPNSISYDCDGDCGRRQSSITNTPPSMGLQCQEKIRVLEDVCKWKVNVRPLRRKVRVAASIPSTLPVSSTRSDSLVHSWLSGECSSVVQNCTRVWCAWERANNDNRTARSLWLYNPSVFNKNISHEVIQFCQNQLVSLKKTRDSLSHSLKVDDSSDRRLRVQQNSTRGRRRKVVCRTSLKNIKRMSEKRMTIRKRLLYSCHQQLIVHCQLSQRQLAAEKVRASLPASFLFSPPSRVHSFWGPFCLKGWKAVGTISRAVLCGGRVSSPAKPFSIRADKNESENVM